MDASSYIFKKCLYFRAVKELDIAKAICMHSGEKVFIQPAISNIISQVVAAILVDVFFDNLATIKVRPLGGGTAVGFLC